MLGHICSVQHDERGSANDRSSKGSPVVTSGICAHGIRREADAGKHELHLQRSRRATRLEVEWAMAHLLQDGSTHVLPLRAALSSTGTSCPLLRLPAA